MSPRRLRPSLAALASAFFGLLLAGVVLAGTLGSSASAETGSSRETSWGVQTKGNSATISRWKALTWAIEQVGNTIFVGGNFLQVTNGSLVDDQPYLAAFDADTGRWQSWFRPEVGNAVFALEASPDGALFVGGEINTWNGVQLGALQKVDPATGDAWPGWNVRVFGGSSVVRDLKVEADGYLYIVGGFTTISSGGVAHAANGAARVDPTSGAIDLSWRPEIDGTVWGVARSKIDQTVYLAGFFDGVNGDTDDRGFVGVDNSGVTVVHRDVLAYNNCEAPGYCSQMYDVETTPTGLVFIAGVEHSLYVLDGANGHSLAKHHYAGCDPSRNLSCNPVNWIGGEFQEIELSGDRVYATCHCFYDLFSAEEVQPHMNPTGVHSTLDTVAAFSPTTGDRIGSFRPYLSGSSGGFAIHRNLSDGCVWLGGGISSYGPPSGAHLAARDVVRLCDTAGPGPAAQPDSIPPVALSCTLSVTGTDASVSWTTPPGAASAFIERQLADGDWFWRGSSVDTAATLTEELPIDIVVAYQVRIRYTAHQVSAPIPCGLPTTLANPAPAPPSCSASLTELAVTVTWQAPPSAASYVVFRTRDSSTSFWRGRADAPTNSFSDTIEPGYAFVYSVAAKDPNGFLSPQTPCGAPLIAVSQQVQPVASCATDQTGTDATITWTPSTNDNAESYIVARSVNGGDSFWRGRIDAPGASLNDSLFEGVTFQYSVQAKAADGTKSVPITCTPDVVLSGAAIAAPASCVVTVTGSTTEVNWVPATSIETTIVYRSRDAKTHWRGRVDNAGTSFIDDDSTGFVYSVRSQLPDRTRSEPTICS